MAMQATSNPPSPSAQMVGNAFVEQYYHILHNSPEMVHRFYQDSSVLSRPDANGEMTSVATMQGINEKILSLNFTDYKAEIKTADAQKSFNEGVTVLVTGCLTGKDDLRRKFAQSFFLAPQDNGYFVLNDVFRYIDDNEQLENYPDNGVDNIATIPSITDSDPSHVPKLPAPDPLISAAEKDKFVAENAKIPLDAVKQLVQEKEAAVESYSGANEDDFPVVGDSTSATQKDTPKKSYASIVKVARGSGPTKVYVPTNTIKVAPKKPENQTVEVAPPPEPAASVPSSTDILESSSAQEEGEGHSIYIRNLPFNMTPSQLGEEFKKFGPIKQGGIQVRYNKQQGYCFGFVEFQSLSSMNNAIQASPVVIGGCKTVIEIKRTTTRVDSGRGRFYSGWGGFRTDSFRSRGNYGGGGRSFGRNEYREFSGRGRNSAGRGEGHQQGRGRGGRSGEAKQSTSNST